MVLRSSLFFTIFLIIHLFADLHADSDVLQSCQTLRNVESYPFPLKRVHPLYWDDEIGELWNSITDIDHPTIEDYLKIENYLKYGMRPYLDVIFNQGIKMGWGFQSWKPNEPVDRSMLYANRVLQRLMFVGPHGEMPSQEIIALNGASKNDLERVIILYSSYNFDATFGKQLYQEKMFNIIQELEQQGYCGHVLYRLGGYPLEEKGGLFLAHVPYSFKILAIIEASLKGYKEVLWIDTSLHPTNNLRDLFNEIKDKGLYIVYNGINLDYDYNYGIFHDDTIRNCHLEISDLAKIPHTIATIIGISFRNKNHHDFIREWYNLTRRTLPAMSLYPEEFLISIAAWKTQKKPSAFWWEVMNNRSTMEEKPLISDKPFWNDKS